MATKSGSTRTSPNRSRLKERSSSERTSRLEPCHANRRSLSRRAHRGGADDEAGPRACFRSASVLATHEKSLSLGQLRSGESRVGEECRSRWVPHHLKKKK